MAGLTLARTGVGWFWGAPSRASASGQAEMTLEEARLRSRPLLARLESRFIPTPGGGLPVLPKSNCGSPWTWLLSEGNSSERTSDTKEQPVSSPRRLIGLSALLAVVSLCVACGGGAKPAVREGGPEPPGEAPTGAPESATQFAEGPAATEASPQAKKADATSEAQDDALVSAPRRLVPIKSYAVIDAWRRASELTGQRVRLTGVATVKRNAARVYVVFASKTGLTL